MDPRRNCPCQGEHGNQDDLGDGCRQIRSNTDVGSRMKFVFANVVTMYDIYNTICTINFKFYYYIVAQAKTIFFVAQAITSVFCCPGNDQCFLLTRQ